MEFINPPELGAAIAPYSQAVEIAGTIHLAGQVALAADGTTVGEGDIRAQVARVLDRIEIVLDAYDAGLEDIAAATVYLADRADYAGLNDVWQERFGTHRPVRSLVVAELVRPELLIEIQATAVLPAR